MSEDQKKSTELHVETQSSKPTDVVGDVCHNATDKEKCQEFVERLGEASHNIDPENR